MKSLHTIAGLLALTLLSTVTVAEEDKAKAEVVKVDEAKAAPKKAVKHSGHTHGIVHSDAHHAADHPDWRHYDGDGKYNERYNGRYYNDARAYDARYDDARYYDGRNYDARAYDGRYYDGRYDGYGYSYRNGRGLSGWFIGLQAGMNGVRTKDQVDARTTQVTARGGDLGGVGGIFLGWGRNFSKNGYAGLQLEGNLVGAKTSSSMSVTGGTQTASTKTSGVWGGALLLGFRPWASHNTMIYVRLGADMARWKVNATGTPAASSINGSASKTKVAFAPGLGVRSMMYKNMFLNMEYKFAMYGKVRATNTNGNGNSVTSKPTMQTFTVGIGWNF